jgi:hypothetical protein
MRIVPLIPSSCAPDPWRPFPAVELAWTGALHPGWAAPQVHALHLPLQPWGPDLLATALAALGPALGADFLVLRAEPPADRMDTAAFLGVLESLLEVLTQRGQKLALRPLPGAAPALVERLRAVRGEAVGFCWDAEAGADLASFQDRLFCAVGEPGDDFSPIQALGYRWNLAVPAPDPEAMLRARALIERDFPPVLFPRDLPERP